MLGGYQALEELHRSCRPAGHVTCQLLEDRGRALAPPVADGVCDVGALADGVGAFQGVQTTSAQQVSYVRHHPLGTGLDEPVIIQAIYILLEMVKLALQHRHQGAQRLALLDITGTIDGW